MANSTDTKKELSSGQIYTANLQANQAAIAKLAKDANVEPNIAAAARAIDNNPANDVMQARALNAALAAYTEAKESWGIWLRSGVFGGPSNAQAAITAATAASKAQGAGPNDVPNILKAVEKLAK